MDRRLVTQTETSTIKTSYWNMETSGMETSDGGEGRITSEMTYPYADNTFMDWDFDKVWGGDEDHSINFGRFSTSRFRRVVFASLSDP